MVWEYVFAHETEPNHIFLNASPIIYILKKKYQVMFLNYVEFKDSYSQITVIIY